MKKKKAKLRVTKFERVLYVFAILLVFISIMLFVSAHRIKIQVKKVASKKRKNYIVVINFVTGSVLYFEKSNPKEQVNLKLEAFYTHIIDPRSRDLFRTWLENIFSDDRNLLSEITMNLENRNTPGKCDCKFPTRT